MTGDKFCDFMGYPQRFYSSELDAQISAENKEYDVFLNLLHGADVLRLLPEYLRFCMSAYRLLL